MVSRANHHKDEAQLLGLKGGRDLRRLKDAIGLGVDREDLPNKQILWNHASEAATRNSIARVHGVGLGDVFNG